MVTKLLAFFARLTHFRNVLISAAMVALCLQTALLLDWLYIPGWFYVLMFSNTILQYGLYDLLTKKGTTHANPKLLFPSRNRSYYIATIIITAIISAWLFFNLKWLQIYWLLLTGVLILAYYIPILPFKRLRRLKQNHILKLLVPVIVWTISTAVLPTTFIPYGFDEKFYWLLAFRFLFMLGIFIPFDVRDSITGIETASNPILSLIREKGWFRLSYLCLLLAALLLIPGYYLDVSIYYLAALLLSLITTVWMVYYSSKHLFSPVIYIMLDASMILQTVLVCTAILIP